MRGDAAYRAHPCLLQHPCLSQNTRTPGSGPANLAVPFIPAQFGSRKARVPSLRRFEVSTECGNMHFAQPSQALFFSNTGAAFCCSAKAGFHQNALALTHERVIAWSNPLGFKVRNLSCVFIGALASGIERRPHRPIGFLENESENLSAPTLGLKEIKIRFTSAL